MAGLTLAYQLEDDDQVASTYCSLGMLRKDQGQFDDALSYFDQSIAVRSERISKFAWQSKADTLLRLGQFDEAKTLYQKALTHNQTIEDEEGIAHMLHGLAEVAWRNGDVLTAEQRLIENEVICQKLNHSRATSWTMQQLGNVARTRGDWRKAGAYYADAHAQMLRMGDTWGLCEALTEYAHLAVAKHDCARAAQCLSIAQAGWHTIGAKLTQYEQSTITTSLNTCVKHIEPTMMAYLLQQGQDDWVTPTFSCPVVIKLYANDDILGALMHCNIDFTQHYFSHATHGR